MSFFSTIESYVAKFFTSSSSGIASVVMSDIELVASGANTALNAFEALTGNYDAALVAEVKAGIAAVQATVAALEQAISKTAGQPIITQLEADVAAVSSSLTGITLPAVITDVIKAITTLLPYIQTGLGLFSASAAMNSSDTGMTLEQARAILNGNAA